MNPGERLARRYHWLSSSLQSFTEEPHTLRVRAQPGTDTEPSRPAGPAHWAGILALTHEKPDRLMQKCRSSCPPATTSGGGREPETPGAALTPAHETNVADIESLLLLEGVGPRTLQSLTLVSEVTRHALPLCRPGPLLLRPRRQGRAPLPVPTRVYDETIDQARHRHPPRPPGRTGQGRGVEKPLPRVAGNGAAVHPPATSSTNGWNANAPTPTATAARPCTAMPSPPPAPPP